MTDASKTAKKQTYRLRDAWDALMRLREDPDNTRAVFEIIDALTGPSDDKMFQRYRQTPAGRQVLEEKRDLLSVLMNRDALMELPVGSLGREYAEFTARENLSADGLVEASETGNERYENIGEDRARFAKRLRDCHDLEHVVTGYGRDLRGEGALLAFGLAQGWNHGIGAIVAMAYFYGDAEERTLIRSGWKRGRKAKWISASDWEAQLARPLEDVRHDLEVGDPPTYEPLWSQAAPASA